MGAGHGGELVAFFLLCIRPPSFVAFFSCMEFVFCDPAGRSGVREVGDTYFMVVVRGNRVDYVQILLI